ncbi:MAG: (d)CMP kinase [Candidatus Asgardarchaeia archaeon]
MNKGITIAISGPHGAGKSTLARKVAKHFGLRYVSAGMLFRRMAEKTGMNLSEFSKYVEEHPDVDRKIDEMTVEEAKKKNVVLDGRITAWIAKEYADLKILLTAPLEVRVRRIADRDGLEYSSALSETLVREQSESERFKKLYNINVMDFTLFDIVINTSKFSEECCERILLDAIEDFLKEKDEE